MEIARAELSDADEILAVFTASRSDALPYLPVLHTPEEDRIWMHDRVLGECEVWIAREGVAIVGFLALRPGWVEHLYLKPGYYRRGIGSALLDLAKERQPGGLKLWAFQRNARARGFYEARGFRAIELGDGSANEEREPDVLYEWHLYRSSDAGRSGW